MKRAVIWIFGAAVVAGLAGLLWIVPGTDRSEPRGRAVTDEARGSALAAANRSGRRPPRDVASVNDARAERERALIAAGPYEPPPVLPYVPEPAREHDPAQAPPELAAELDAAVAYIGDVTRSCGDTAPATSETETSSIRFAFNISVQSGEASVANIEVLESDMDEQVAGCIVERVRSAHWRANFGDAALTIEHRIAMSDLS